MNYTIDLMDLSKFESLKDSEKRTLWDLISGEESLYIEDDDYIIRASDMKDIYLAENCGRVDFEEKDWLSCAIRYVKHYCYM